MNLKNIIDCIVSEEEKLFLFGSINLGVMSLLERGWSPKDAIEQFYNYENCSFIKIAFDDKITHEIMGRGTQLADIYNLNEEQVFFGEIETITQLCNDLIFESQI